MPKFPLLLIHGDDDMPNRACRLSCPEGLRSVVQRECERWQSPKRPHCRHVYGHEYGDAYATPFGYAIVEGSAGLQAMSIPHGRLDMARRRNAEQFSHIMTA